MEYLLTYGWMVLALAVVLVTLFNFSTFRPAASFVCLGQPGFLCSKPSLSGSGALTINLSYSSYNYPITITGLSCNVTSSTKPPSVETTQLTLYPNQQTQLLFQCPITGSSIGSTDDVYLWIYYNTPFASGLEQPFGKGVLAVQYSGVAWNVTTWTPSSNSVQLLPYSDLTSNPASPAGVTDQNSIVWTSFAYQNEIGWGYSTDYHNHDIYNGIEITLFPISPLSLDDAPCSGPPYASHGYTATTFVNFSGTYTFGIVTDDGTQIFYKSVPGSTWTAIFSDDVNGIPTWNGQPPTYYTNQVSLPKGKYELAVDFIDMCDPAGLSVVTISPPPQT
jgi:hypothetical protein